MAPDNDEMPDFAEEEHGVPRLSQVWEEELEEAPVVMALSPKGQLLAVGTVDEAIAVLDVSSGKVAHTLAGHRGGTNGLAFLSGNSLVSVGEDGKARMWNVVRATCQHELAVDAEGADRTGSGHSVTHLTVAPDGNYFACSAGKLITIFSLGGSPQEAPAKKVLGPMESTVESLRYDRGGNLLATYNGGVSYWQLADRMGEDKQELPLPYNGACLCGDVTPDKDYIVVGCHDATVHIYHFTQHQQSGVELKEMTCGGYDSKVIAVDFNPAGDRMASAGGSRNTVWDFSASPTGTMPTLAVGHFGAITCQAWQPDDDHWLATAAKDGRVYVYDVTNSVPMAPDMPYLCQPGAIGLTDEDEVTTLVFARDGVLYTGHISGLVRRWELPLAGSSSSSEEEDSEEEEEGEGEEEAPPAQAAGAAEEGA